MEFLLPTFDRSARHILYFLCIFVSFFTQNLCELSSHVATNNLKLNLAPGSEAMDYAEDYWVGPIPPDYIQVNEKNIDRKSFEPAEFNFVGKNVIEAEDNAKNKSPTENENNIGNVKTRSASKNKSSKNNKLTKCMEKVMDRYPDATCEIVTNMKSCIQMCEKIGIEKCRSNGGSIRKINCKPKKKKKTKDYSDKIDKSENNEMTCCCNVKCDPIEKPARQLLEEYGNDKNCSRICVGYLDFNPNTEPSERLSPIKKILSKACKTDNRIQTALKQCNKEKKGEYFCTKDAKCIGSACIGCIKHSCEIDGIESFFNISSKNKDEDKKKIESKKDLKEDKCYFQNDKGEKVDLDKIPSNTKLS